MTGVLEPGHNCAHRASAPDEGDIDLTSRTFTRSTLGIDSLRRQQDNEVKHIEEFSMIY